MKTLTLLFSTVVIALGTAFAPVVDVPADDTVQDRVKIYLHNKCSSDVKVYVKSPGSSTKYTVEDGYKKPYSFLEGTKVYDESGNKLIVEVTSASEGKTFVVCE